ncbi:MAG TPA: ABC transporter substrate-binding protein [Acidimicrobiales bacterium]|jgi:branched-chain amino acid transport system substrate-binding protein
MFDRVKVAALALALAGPVAGWTSTASAATPSSGAGVPGVSATSITIGFVTSETGPAAPTFSDGAGGALARFALQNAKGGVDGRKLQLVTKDDQSSPTTAGTVGTELAGSNVFGVIEDSAIDEDYETGDKALAVDQVPVTTWGSNTVDPDVFDAYGANVPGLGGTLDGATYGYNYIGPFFKSIGVKRLAGVTYTTLGTGFNESLAMLKKQDHIVTCYDDVNVPIGGVNFTVDALAISHSNCDAVYVSAVDSTDVAIASALKNEGSTAKQLYATGYDNEVLGQPLSASALNGAYFLSELNMTDPNAATKTMLSALKKYDKSYKGGLPDLGTVFAYLSANLMIEGLQLAGANPTRPAFIANLRNVSTYNAGGLLPDNLTFTHFGTAAGLPATQCEYYMQLRSGKYYSTHGAKPLCGPLVKLSS